MISIRKAEMKDITQIQTIAQKSWRDTYQGLIPENVQSRFLKDAYSDEMMLVRMQKTLLFVAERHGDLVGFANAGQKGSAGFLHAIYLMPEVKGQGIGTKLLQKILRELDSIQEMHVEVEEGNVSGEMFYAAKGFIEVGAYEEELYGHKLKTKKLVLKRIKKRSI